MPASAKARPTADRTVLILEAACRVIARNGAHGLRMAAVAREAKVSKALVHYYFDTRQELMRRAFAFSEERFQHALEEELRAAADGAERVERVLLASIATGTAFSEQRALGNEVWSTLREDAELRPLVERSYRRWLDRIATEIDTARLDGSVAADVDPDAAAWRLAATADGLDSMLYLGLTSRESAEELMRGAIARELHSA